MDLMSQLAARLAGKRNAMSGRSEAKPSTNKNTSKEKNITFKAPRISQQHVNNDDDDDSDDWEV